MCSALAIRKSRASSFSLRTSCGVDGNGSGVDEEVSVLSALVHNVCDDGSAAII